MQYNKEIGVLFDLDGVLVDTETSYTGFYESLDRIYPTGVEKFPYVIKGTTLDSILSKYFPDKEIQTGRQFAERNLVHGQWRYPAQTVKLFRHAPSGFPSGFFALLICQNRLGPENRRFHPRSQ